MVPYMAFIHWVINSLVPFLSVVTHIPYTYGAISSSMSTKIPRILMIAIYVSCSVCVLMKAFGISINATTISSFVYMMQLSSNDYFATVGYLESSFEM